MSTQPNLIRPSERSQSLREAPSVSNTLLAFSTCTRKLYSARLVKGHFRLIRSGLIGNAGISISRSWMIGFDRR